MMEVNKTIKLSLFDLKSSGIQKIKELQNLKEKNIPFSEKIINIKIEMNILGKGKIKNKDEAISNEFFSPAGESMTNRLQNFKKIHENPFQIELKHNNNLFNYYAEIPKLDELTQTNKDFKKLEIQFKFLVTIEDANNANNTSEYTMKSELQILRKHVREVDKISFVKLREKIVQADLIKSHTEILKDLDDDSKLIEKDFEKNGLVMIFAKAGKLYHCVNQIIYLLNMKESECNLNNFFHIKEKRKKFFFNFLNFTR